SKPPGPLAQKRETQSCGTGLATSGRLWHDARAMLDPLSESKQQMSPTPTPRKRFRPPYAVCGCLLGLAAARLTRAAPVALGRTFHAVVPGRAYRSAQPTTADLERAVREYGVRTVVNLRGAGEPFDWFLEESRATHRLGLAQEDLCFSSYRLPAAHEVRYLVEVFDRSAPPLLIHCRRGADRTGLVATVFLLSPYEVPLGG